MALHPGASTPLRRHPHRRGQTRPMVPEGHRAGGINVSFWLAVGLVLPALYALALLLAVVIDQFRAA